MLTGTYVCTEPSCNTKTRQLLIDGRCFNTACKGRVMSDRFTEKITNDTLRYLQGLFDVKKYHIENKVEINKRDVPYEDEFVKIKKLVDDVIEHSKYNKVDLNALFSFMSK